LAETTDASLPVAEKSSSASEARSILMWGAPMQMDAMWEEIFARRERHAE
jgi:hypothetical protein